jgi:AcrR family transcriptional regulator
METAETILLAAERLFAERGFGVSLREIGVAAGQRNHSAVQYHFGTRDRLVGALYEYRMVPLNRRRLALIGELRAAGLEGDTSALVDAYIRPLAEHVLSRRGESWYMRFIARHALSGAPPKWPFPEQYASGIAALTDMLIAAVGDLPRVRRNSMNLHLTMVLASLEQQLDDPAFTTAQAGKVIDDLFRTTVAILTAPGPV